MKTTCKLLVEVNRDVCLRLAALLKCYEIPSDEEESKPDFSDDLVGNFFLALVAICHQTSPRGLPPLEGEIDGVYRKGWDYLFTRFESAALEDESLLEPARWKCLTASDVRQIFHDPKNGERLTDLQGRAALFHDLGHKMLGHGWNRADQIHAHCEGRIALGDRNLLETLSQFRAFDDPVRKKTLFFLALMKNSNEWVYQDESNLGTPVDYHEVRGHLRMGTVVVLNDELQNKLYQELAVTEEEDIAIRHAVYEAIMLISAESDLNNPSQLHYLFWNVFRSVCLREKAQCLDILDNTSLHLRYLKLAPTENGKRQCPFASICVSACKEKKYMEHVFSTDYY